MSIRSYDMESGSILRMKQLMYSLLAQSNEWRTSSLLSRNVGSASALLQGQSGADSQEIWRPQGDGRSRVFIHAKSRDRVGGEIRLKGVTMFHYTINREGGMEFIRRYEAENLDREAVLEAVDELL